MIFRGRNRRLKKRIKMKKIIFTSIIILGIVYAQAQNYFPQIENNGSLIYVDDPIEGKVFYLSIKNSNVNCSPFITGPNLNGFRVEYYVTSIRALNINTPPEISEYYLLYRSYQNVGNTCEVYDILTCQYEYTGNEINSSMIGNVVWIKARLLDSNDNAGNFITYYVVLQ